MPNVPRPIDPHAIYLPVNPPRGDGSASRLGTWRTGLREQIQQAVAAGHDVVLECSEAGYLDTATIGMLLRCSREAREVAHRVTLVGCPEEQLEVFTQARLLDRLEVQPIAQRKRA